MQDFKQLFSVPLICPECAQKIEAQAPPPGEYTRCNCPSCGTPIEVIHRDQQFCRDWFLTGQIQ